MKKLWIVLIVTLGAALAKRLDEIAAEMAEEARLNLLASSAGSAGVYAPEFEEFQIT